MSARVAELVSGGLFGAGLALGGMTRPDKVIAFLDVTGDWDPSLALVMIGALIVHLIAWRLVRLRERPLAAPAFDLPTRTQLEPSLVIGAALFGAGWGLAGYCPGPALVSLGALLPSTLLFVVAMIAGQLLFLGLQRRAAVRQGPASPAGDRPVAG